jgi:hypothetical protein
MNTTENMTGTTYVISLYAKNGSEVAFTTIIAADEMDALRYGTEWADGSYREVYGLNLSVMVTDYFNGRVLASWVPEENDAPAYI